MAKKVVLYIEDTEIKLLVTSGNKVEKWASLMLDEGLVEQGVILNEKRVAESIQELFKKQGIGDTNITLGLSGLNSIFRILTLPEVPKNMLPEAVNNEAGRVLPVPLSQVYYAYQPLPAPKGEIKLFLVAYPRNSTEILLSTIAKAGLKANVVDLAPLALARCVNSPRAVLVNAWLTFLDIVILVDRVPQVIRSVSLPIESASLADRLPSIAEEITRTITFYNSSNVDKQLDKTIPLFVCGDLAREEESWQYLEKLGNPVSVLKPPLQYSEAFNPTQYMVNIGLALKGQVPGGDTNQYSIIDLNVLPEAYKPPSFSWTRVLVPVGAVIALGVLAYGVLMVMNVRDEAAMLQVDYAKVQADTLKMRAEIKPLQDNLTGKKAIADALPAQSADIVNKIKALVDNTNFFKATMSKFLLGLDTTGKEAREISKLAPAGLSLTEVTHESGSITLKGVASGENPVLTYARSLRSSVLFDEVIVLSIKQTMQGVGVTATPVYEFEIIVR
jgi:type IV pilus assembly protein PilM